MRESSLLTLLGTSLVRVIEPHPANGQQNGNNRDNHDAFHEYNPNFHTLDTAAGESFHRPGNPVVRQIPLGRWASQFSLTPCFSGGVVIPQKISLEFFPDRMKVFFGQ